MKFVLEKLGVLEKAEFSLGELTIICGGNNTGKTYATYALYGFLWHFHGGNFSRWIDSSRELLDYTCNAAKSLLDTGSVAIDINLYIRHAPDIMKHISKSYSQDMHNTLASREKYLDGSKFSVEIKSSEIQPQCIEKSIGSTKNQLIAISNMEDPLRMNMSIMVEQGKMQWDMNFVIHLIESSILEILFGKLLPRPFIVNAERTGVSIFKKELDFARNRLIDEASSRKDKDKNIDILGLLSRLGADYAMPVKHNIDFARGLENISKDTSFISREHPDVLDDFSDIVGGKYIANKSDDTVYFKPNGGKSVKLTMDESSSAVRALLDMGFYLKHIASKGDLLMIDEPELNLHPENQRKITKLFARLANLGIKVFITTHSDYITKELSTLIMLNNDNDKIGKVASDYGYSPEEFIDYKDVRVYIAEKALMDVEGSKKRQRKHTLVQARVEDDGIEVGTFNKTIIEMEKIQDEIIWGCWREN